MSVLTDIASLLTDETSVLYGDDSNFALNNVSPNPFLFITNMPGGSSRHVFGQQEPITRTMYVAVTVIDPVTETGYGRCDTINNILDGYVSDTLYIQLHFDVRNRGNDKLNRTYLSMVYKVTIYT